MLKLENNKTSLYNRILAGKAFFLLFAAVWIFFPLKAQDMGQIGKGKFLLVNGGISVNQMGYLSSDTLSRRDPYNFYLSGNLNFNVYGWSVPFTFNYSNQKVTFTQPFNQYSLHPQYKWILIHAGYTSMSFSPYTLSGHLFLGAGVELTPKGPFRLSAMYGRLRKAIEYDTAAGEYALPAEYERWGYGMKAGYDFSESDLFKAKVDITLFHARDKAGSLHQLPDSMVYPGENLVLGTNLDVMIAGHFSFTTELASSMVTRNTLSAFEEGGVNGWNRFMGSFYGSNSTTEYFAARKFNLGYSSGQYMMGVGYERIDPGYNTFGAYYFNNDMENITVNGSARLFENRINLSANVGKQHDNLDKTKSSELKRWVTAFNLGYNSQKNLNMNISYSTFTSFMNIRSQFVDINQLTPYDNLDTLNFTQLSSTLTASAGYVLKNTDEVRQNINLNFSHQTSSDKQGGVDTTGGVRYYMTTASYSYTMVPLSLSVSAAFNTNFTDAPGMKTKTLGPTLAVNKLLFDKKLRNSLSVSYNQAYSNNKKQNRVFSARINSSYRLGKRHNFNLGITFMNRKTKIQTDPYAISEFIGTLGYSMSF